MGLVVLKKKDIEAEYFSTYSRNMPMIPLELQEKLKEIRIGVAGCGSTGGAFVDGALRVGVQHFHLCDNGLYDLSNLNRQMVSRDDLEKNKAVTYQKKILNVNANADVKVWPEGLQNENIQDFMSSIDFLFDAVDVTTPEGLRMKLRLHEYAAENKIPTGSALDLGYTQWIKSYNYQTGEPALQGRLEKARKIKHPLKALLSGFISVEELPLEISEELIRLIQNPNANACQLASACFLLSSIVTPYLLYFLQNKALKPLVVVDIQKYFDDEATIALRLTRIKDCHNRLSELLDRLE